ncbi:MAG: tetratricopeptide repeat protein, partial [Planctomycetota bacterium]
MTGESKAWASLRREYLRQVEKALSSVRHPRARDVLDDVGAHLDRRLAELTPEQRSDEALRVIIADMGPPTDYATLLEPEGATCHAGAPGRSMWWGVLAGVVVIVVAVVVIVAMRGMWRAPDRIAAEELAAEAWSMWRQRKLSQAEALFLKAVETDPTHADAWNGLGWSQFNQGKATTAATSFEKCLNIEPEHAAALNGLGWIAKGEGRIDDAIGHWQRAVEALPAATAALRGLATTYMERQQYDEAVAIYEKWLRVEPNNARVKADLERAKKHLPIAGLDDLPQLLAELSDPEAPRFVALNRIIQIGTPAVPALIEEMGTSFNWQIPKALGAIGDKRAVKPLIEKLEKSDFSPMREVVVEALGRITGQDFGAAAEQWRAWWERAGQNVDGGGLSENAHMAVPGAAPVYIVTFRPTGQFRPQTARELLEAFNKGHPRGVRTHHYRTQVKDNALVGRICVDTEAGKDAVVKMLQRSAELTPVEAVSATPEVLEELKKSKQLSLPSARAPDSAPIYIVTFRPTGQFHPQTARELLQAFNRKHPRGVRTHHYRTQIKDNALVGYICVDTEAGKDAVVKMLEGSTELELAEVVRATPQMLEENENRRQVSLPSARVSSAALRQTSRRVREPTSPNRTVRRTGTWPPGDCFIYGYVLRRARLSRVDHAKVCLSSDKFGSWVVEVEGNGSVNFQGIPAGTYRLYTTDTLGYQDTYHNPRNVDDERPTFELNEGDRIKPGMEIKPIRPYRRITGRVLDERGEVLAECDGLTVSAWVQRPQGSWEGHYRVLSRSNVQEDGSYVL